MINKAFQAPVHPADLNNAEQHASNSATQELIMCIRQHCIEQRLPIDEISCEHLDAGVEDYISGAESLLLGGYAAEAELVLLAAVFLYPNAQGAVLRIAQLYESQRRYDRTVSFAKHLLGTKGPNIEATYQLSFALYMLGRSDEAFEYLLPLYVSEPSRRVSRLCGLLLKSIGNIEDAIDILTSTIESYPDDSHSIAALAQIYTEVGLSQQGLDVLRRIPADDYDANKKLQEALIYRYMGELDRSIEIIDEIIGSKDFFPAVLWPQCFNYSIAGSGYSEDLLSLSQQYWNSEAFFDPCQKPRLSHAKNVNNRQIRIGILTSDIGEHVVSRFLTPLVRNYDRNKFYVALLSVARRFDASAPQIASCFDHATSLEGLSLNDASQYISAANLDIVIDTNGFTKDSGLPILSRRCAAIQCHYIGYHATTGLTTIDYFLGDAITTPDEFQSQYTEKLVQIPRLWMAYDHQIDFPDAVSKSTRNSPVFGAFSQIAKINDLTLQYWAAAMVAAPESILVIKDRGVQCPATRMRIEDTFKQYGVNPDRVYFFGPVGSHLDHLDSYNAIDVALDTTPWSGATTAFEALGMGIPLVAICGDTTSGRMSTSVVSAAGYSHWVAHSKKEFASIAAKLAKNYQQIRKDKSFMQKQIRSGILFDEQRIRNDFYRTIERLVVGRKHDKKE